MKWYNITLGVDVTKLKMYTLNSKATTTIIHKKL